MGTSHTRALCFKIFTLRHAQFRATLKESTVSNLYAKLCYSLNMWKYPHKDRHSFQSMVVYHELYYNDKLIDIRVITFEYESQFPAEISFYQIGMHSHSFSFNIKILRIGSTENKFIDYNPNVNLLSKINVEWNLDAINSTNNNIVSPKFNGNSFCLCATPNYGQLRLLCLPPRVSKIVVLCQI